MLWRMGQAPSKVTFGAFGHKVWSCRHLLILLIVTLTSTACGGGESIIVEETASSEETRIVTMTEVSQAPSTMTPLATSVPLPLALATIDAELKNTLEGSIAHNAPEQMAINEVVDLQLLISPSSESMPPSALALEISAAGQIISETLEITPWMKAELESSDPDAFFIRAIHSESEQVLSSIEPTEWKWSVLAREPGEQLLYVTVYRLLEVEGRENWRAVEEYRHNMNVEVTWAYRLANIGQALPSAVIFPVVVILLAGFTTWLARRLWRSSDS